MEQCDETKRDNRSHRNASVWRLLTDEPKTSSPDPSNCWVGGSVIALQDIVYSRSKWDFEAWRRLRRYVVARQEGNVDTCGSEFETET